MADSIYYLELGELPAFLGRTMGMLNQSGVLLLRCRILENIGSTRRRLPGCIHVWRKLKRIYSALRVRRGMALNRREVS